MVKPHTFPKIASTHKVLLTKSFRLVRPIHVHINLTQSNVNQKIYITRILH